MFTNFDGAHRRTPNVSIRGASKKESKEELLERAHRERTRRENERLHLAKALEIQSFYRGYLARKSLKEELRSRFDSIRVSRKSDFGDEKIILANSIKIFFDKFKDAERLTWLCQTCVKERQDIFQKLEVWLPFKISHLITLSLRYCSELATAKDNLGPALRFLEIFSNTSLFPPNIRTNQCKTLISKGYYLYLRRMCDSLIPPIYKETTVPPTPISEVIMELINSPLNLLSSGDKSINDDLRCQVITEVTSNFFNTPFSEQLELFVLPSMASNPNFPLEAWSDVLISQQDLVPTPWLFYACVSIGQQLTKIGRNSNAFVHYLSVLEKMSSSIIPYRHLSHSLDSNFNHSDESEESEPDDNEESGVMDTSNPPDNVEHLKPILKKSLALLNSSNYTKTLASVVDSTNDPGSIQSLCRLCHNLLIFDQRALHQFKILSILAFRPTFLHNLWNLILSKRRVDNFGGKFVPLVTVISRGMRLSRQEMGEFVPLLAVFDSLFAYLLVTIHDIEFYGDEVEGEEPQKHRWMPFKLSELVPMSLALRDATLGLIELAYPETRPPMLSDEYRSSLAFETNSNYLSQSDEIVMWTHLFKATVELVRQLHTRDTRRRFCPDEHWTSERVALTVEKVPSVFFQPAAVRRYRLFQGLTRLERSQLAKDGPPQSAQTVRLITVLREIPYAVPFYQRIRVFQGMVSTDREEHQNDMEFFVRDKAIAIHCRRNFLYEDAFDKLSPDNEPNLRLKMKISLSNTVGLEEAGVDGGGLFREFLSELLKTAFDPNRGFFRLTKDQQLYPNPSVAQIIENYVPHYFFIGRMLGKALYENMLIELPFASFFLSKLLVQHSSNVDIDHLQSLDPELYKNLLYLKTYDGNVQDLGLDFTVVSEELGQTIVEELKPNGSEIPVTNENRIEYVHLVADYKLNRQIRTQCNAFRYGLSDVIKLEWLRMFSYRELQTLISGADHAINVDDLMTNTTYGHGFTDTHDTVAMFWNVVRSFTESQKRKLLKFVTSCSRPPLLGFKDLTPPFCIQNAGDVPDRLPTSSTCMNLLKLPEFKSEEVLKGKLLYAIESGAGFELS